MRAGGKIRERIQAANYRSGFGPPRNVKFLVKGRGGVCRAADGSRREADFVGSIPTIHPGDRTQRRGSTPRAALFSDPRSAKYLQRNPIAEEAVGFCASGGRGVHCKPANSSYCFSALAIVTLNASFPECSTSAAIARITSESATAATFNINDAFNFSF